MHFTFNLALPGTRLSGSALAAVDTTRGGGQCLALWQVSGRGGVWCNDNANVFGLKVQREGALGQSGWRVVCGHRRSQLNRQEIWGENWGDEGWPLPVIKKKVQKVWPEPLFNGAYAAFHGVLNRTRQTVALPKPISQH